MSDYLKELHLVDLLSEKHKELRKKVMELWLQKDGEYISDTESHMLGMLEIKNMTVAECARKMNISRQATHKCSKKLIERGYIVTSSIEGNNRDILLALTERGDEYCSEMLKLKKTLEEEVAKKIGKENVKMLKNLLKKEWIEN